MDSFLFFVFWGVCDTYPGLGRWSNSLRRENPDINLPSHFHQLLRRDTKMFLSKLRDIVFSVCPWPTLGSPPGLACPKHFLRETFRTHPDQMPEPPQLCLFYVFPQTFTKYVISECMIEQYNVCHV